VSNGQYRRFNPRHTSMFREDFTLDANDQPVVCVSWDDARKYVAWLNRNYAAAIPKGWKVRLPREDEWEYVARCGGRRIYPWGNAWPPAYGNFSDLAARRSLSDWSGIRGYDDGFPVTCPVTQSGANEWGLYGMAGNVWEWCEDWYDASKKYKVRRGGGWDFDTQDALRVDARGFDRPEAKYDTIGFRLVIGRDD
jgi:formylglycine-generating enzyme required for sulfatase activity